MALDFPDSPSDGQFYEGFVWDDTAGLWRVRGSVNNYAGISATTGSPTTDTIGSSTVYIWKTDGSLTVDVDGIAHILVVGGGGRGGTGSSGNASGGGGGAGGVLEITQAYLPAGTHDIRVGLGSTVSGILLPHGRGSRLGPYYALGGGDGGYWFGGYTHTGQNGASGGGARDFGTARGLGMAGQGNDGGTGGASNGGGGAGEAANTDGAGQGGDGVIVSIINSTIATSRSVGQVVGSDVYFGGGGAGGAVDGGGLGGGGNQHTAAVAHTGGGGGAGDSGNEVSGAGGSGVVIVRIGG